MVAETGENPNDGSVAPYSGNTDQLLNIVKANFPAVFAMVIWSQHQGISQQNGASAFMNDSAIINLTDLPPGL